MLYFASDYLSERHTSQCVLQIVSHSRTALRQAVDFINVHMPASRQIETAIMSKGGLTAVCEPVDTLGETTEKGVYAT